MDEGVEQVAVADIARGQAVAMAVDVADKAVKYGLTILFRHQTHLQSYGVGALATRAHKVGVGMVELLDERGLDAVGTGLLHQVVPPVENKIH